ncbi:hypothetical protein KIPB_008982, partial [Kipferlia bialata]
FEKAIITVAPGVYVANGYSISTITLVVGPEGVVVIDTGMDMGAAKDLVEDFKAICPLPVSGVIYTHGHGDHVGGARAWVPVDGAVSVYGRPNLGQEDSAFVRAGLKVQGFRGAAQAGLLLPPGKVINNGVAATFNAASFAGDASGKVPITHNVTEHTKVTLGGVSLELFPCTGETHDALYVWLPETKVLITGDLFFASFPNTAPVRGAEYRDVQGWVECLTSMLSLPFEALIGGHGRPYTTDAKEVLTNYRDALSYVFTETIACINKHMTPDQIVHTVKLPDHLRDLDYLGEYYGNVEWTIRGIYSGLLGFFDGNPTTLFSLPQRGEAQRMANLAGGVDKLLASCKAAVEQGDYQWGAQLCDHLLALEGVDVAMLKNLKATCLDALGDALLATTGRNYYHTSAMILRKQAAAMQ